MKPASRWSCNTSLGDIGSVCTITYTLANSSTLEALQVGETWLVGIDYFFLRNCIPVVWHHVIYEEHHLLACCAGHRCLLICSFASDSLVSLVDRSTCRGWNYISQPTASRTLRHSPTTAPQCWKQGASNSKPLHTDAVHTRTIR